MKTILFSPSFTMRKAKKLKKNKESLRHLIRKIISNQPFHVLLNLKLLTCWIKVFQNVDCCLQKVSSGTQRSKNSQQKKARKRFSMFFLTYFSTCFFFCSLVFLLVRSQNVQSLIFYTKTSNYQSHTRVTRKDTENQIILHKKKRCFSLLFISFGFFFLAHLTF